MGSLEPSSNQAGSGEQFKRKKSISVGRPLFQKQEFLDPYSFKPCHHCVASLRHVQGAAPFWDANPAAFRLRHQIAAARIAVGMPRHAATAGRDVTYLHYERHFQKSHEREKLFSVYRVDRWKKPAISRYPTTFLRYLLL
jgi:hypothetical protein